MDHKQVAGPDRDGIGSELPFREQLLVAVAAFRLVHLRYVPVMTLGNANISWLPPVPRSPSLRHAMFDLCLARSHSESPDETGPRQLPGAVTTSSITLRVLVL